MAEIVSKGSNLNKTESEVCSGQLSRHLVMDGQGRLRPMSIHEVSVWNPEGLFSSGSLSLFGHPQNMHTPVSWTLILLVSNFAKWSHWCSLLGIVVQLWFSSSQIWLGIDPALAYYSANIPSATLPHPTPWGPEVGASPRSR